MSRASLREALSSLSALGVVSVQPGKGVFVQAADEAPGFAWPFAAQATPLDIFQLRYALEGFAAGLAAVTLSTAELDSLEDNVEAMRKVLKAGDFEAAARLDFEFHQRILLASGNQAMVSILDNIIEAPRRVLGQSKAEAIEVAEALLAKVGISDKRHAYPAQLSGGQQQRAAIARTLAMQPKVILFDEPTSALDPEMVQEVLNVIRALAEEGRTMLLVTHEMGFARQVSSEVVFLHQGLVEEQGSPQQVFENPLSARCKQFMSSNR